MEGMLPRVDNQSYKDNSFMTCKGRSPPDNRGRKKKLSDSQWSFASQLINYNYTFLENNLKPKLQLTKKP